MHLGLAYSGMFPVRDLVELARTADGGPVEGVWTFEHLGYRDAFVPAAAIIAATSRLRVVPTAVSPYGRNAMLAAMQTATLAELAPGRVDLVLAAGNPMAHAESGMDQPLPVDAVATHLGSLRALWSGERVRPGGEPDERRATFHVPVDPRPSLFVAAMRPRMLALAGRLADGVLLSAALAPPAIEAARELVRAAAASRSDGVTPSVAATVLVSPDRSRARAVERAREMLAYLLRARSISADVPGERLPMDLKALRRAWERRDRDAAIALVPDAIVEACSVAGTEDECRERLHRYAELGVDTLVLLPAGDDEAVHRSLDVAVALDRG